MSVNSLLLRVCMVVSVLLTVADEEKWDIIEKIPPGKNSTNYQPVVIFTYTDEIESCLDSVNVTYGYLPASHNRYELCKIPLSDKTIACKRKQDSVHIDQHWPEDSLLSFLATASISDEKMERVVRPLVNCFPELFNFTTSTNVFIRLLIAAVTEESDSTGIAETQPTATDFSGELIKAVVDDATEKEPNTSTFIIVLVPLVAVQLVLLVLLVFVIRRIKASTGSPQQRAAKAAAPIEGNSNSATPRPSQRTITQNVTNVTGMDLWDNAQKQANKSTRSMKSKRSRMGRVSVSERKKKSISERKKKSISERKKKSISERRKKAAH
ncbi:hypothetical protein OESDEN_03974 [Oesophagostomum dentatum]|uniref:Uncharacterized protein n=1 Tax=Oesophagostomum dentatum TaxID=61180 RepID=A0A0B1TJT3_OESDE|nr:hypothetical protein OESDEN_03974 [Oesophagostomum dentatum]